MVKLDLNSHAHRADFWRLRALSASLGSWVQCGADVFQSPSKSRSTSLIEVDCDDATQLQLQCKTFTWETVAEYSHAPWHLVPGYLASINRAILFEVNGRGAVSVRLVRHPV